jgi:3-oxoacyl-[acyl-carrier protein] reductase
MLAERRVIVTGAGRGIGRAIALACAAEGAILGLNHRTSRAGAESLRDEIRSRFGSEARLLPFDVADAAAVQGAIDGFVEREGRLDALVNNAAVVEPGLLATLDDASIQRTIRTNLLGPLNCIRAVLPAMLRRRSGVVLNIGSTSAAHPGSGQAVYAATKGAIESLTRAVAAEYGRKGVRCVCIRPGPIETTMSDGVRELVGDVLRARIPLGRFGTPEEVAAAAVYLLSDRAAYVTGTVFAVDGGFAP